MVAIGVVYLVFENSIIRDSSPSTKLYSPRNHITRGLIGAQIGLTLLAMIITRSSALSLQAKTGLPRGNQILGWVVLGKFLRNQQPT